MCYAHLCLIYNRKGILQLAAYLYDRNLYTYHRNFCSCLRLSQIFIVSVWLYGRRAIIRSQITILIYDCNNVYSTGHWMHLFAGFRANGSRKTGGRRRRLGGEETGRRVRHVGSQVRSRRPWISLSFKRLSSQDVFTSAKFMGCKNVFEMERQL